MSKRHRMPQRKSEKHFSRNARVHPKNVAAPLRGGIRL